MHPRMICINPFIRERAEYFASLTMGILYMLGCIFSRAALDVRIDINYESSRSSLYSFQRASAFWRINTHKIFKTGSRACKGKKQQRQRMKNMKWAHLCAFLYNTQTRTGTFRDFLFRRARRTLRQRDWQFLHNKERHAARVDCALL